MRIAAALIAALSTGLVFAKLPPLSDEAKAKAAETAAKSAWTDKVGQYKTCLAIERTAENYRKTALAAGKEVRPPVATPPCADPGPFAAPASRPLEASGAHSPPETATAPPSTKVPAAAKQ
jgi:hypothetical protein